MTDLSSLNSLFGQEISASDIKFCIHIESNLESGHFDAQIAQALINLQQSFYTLVAKTLYGEEATIQSLSEADKDKFRLQFQVGSGSTNAIVDVLEKAAELVESLKEMPKENALILAAACVLIFAGYESKEAYVSFLEEQTKVELSKQETERLNAVAIKMQQLGQECSEVFAKNAKGATKVAFGKRVYDEAQIKEMQKRAPRSSLAYRTVDEDYRVLSVDLSKDGVISALLLDVKGNRIKASYGMDDAEEDDGLYVLNALCESLAKQKNIKLTMSLGTKGDEIKKAVILDVP